MLFDDCHQVSQDHGTEIMKLPFNDRSYGLQHHFIRPVARTPLTCKLLQQVQAKVLPVQGSPGNNKAAARMLLV